MFLDTQPSPNVEPQFFDQQPVQPTTNAITSDFLSQAIASALAAAPMATTQTLAPTQITNQPSHEVSPSM